LPASAGSGGKRAGAIAANAGVRGIAPPLPALGEASNFAQGKASDDVNPLK